MQKKKEKTNWSPTASKQWLMIHFIIWWCYIVSVKFRFIDRISSISLVHDLVFNFLQLRCVCVCGPVCASHLTSVCCAFLGWMQQLGAALCFVPTPEQIEWEGDRVNSSAGVRLQDRRSGGGRRWRVRRRRRKERERVRWDETQSPGWCLSLHLRVARWGPPGPAGATTIHSQPLSLRGSFHLPSLVPPS